MTDFASKTAKASIKAGMTLQKEEPVLPDDELIRLLRIDREAHLWPGILKIDALLRKHDELFAAAQISEDAVNRLGNTISDLLAENLKLRTQITECAEWTNAQISDFGLPFEMTDAEQEKL